MEIFIADKTPEVLRLIAPHIIETPGANKQQILDPIIKGMIEYPDQMCIVVAFDGAKLVGSGISWIVLDHVWVDQAWIDPNYSREEVGFKLLDITKNWALEKDIHDMRFETSRSAKALTKAWGFEEFSSIMRMEF